MMFVLNDLHTHTHADWQLILQSYGQKTIIQYIIQHLTHTNSKLVFYFLFNSQPEPGLYGDKSSALSLMGVEPTER